MGGVPKKGHCVKNVQIRSFFWSMFSCIRTEYGDLLRKSSYSVRIKEITDQKKLRIWTLFTQWVLFLVDCSGWKGYSHRRLFFSQVNLPEIKAGSSSYKFKGFGVRNKFKYSTEHLDLPGHCKYLSVSSLRIKKNGIIFPGSKHISQRNTPVSQENR